MEGAGSDRGVRRFKIHGLVFSVYSVDVQDATLHRRVRMRSLSTVAIVEADETTDKEVSVEVFTRTRTLTWLCTRRTAGCFVFCCRGGLLWSCIIVQLQFYGYSFFAVTL